MSEAAQDPGTTAPTATAGAGSDVGHPVVAGPASSAQSGAHAVVDHERRREAADAAAAQLTGEQMRREWGEQYGENVRLIRGFVEALPAGLAHALRNGETDDGTPLLSDPDVLRYLGAIARGGGAAAPRDMTPGQERNTIEHVMRMDPKRYWRDSRMQARFRDLVGRGAQSEPLAGNGGGDEAARLLAMSAAPRGSPAWRHYWKGGGEQRLRELQAKGAR